MSATSELAARRIGVLLAGDRSYPSFSAFREGLHDLGHIEGQTIWLESRFAEGQLDRLPALASELVSAGVDVLAVIGAVAFWAARQATSGIPLVFAIVLDPVAAGMIANADRHEANITGATSFDAGQASSQIRILKQTVPGLARLGILGDAGVPDILANLSRAAAEAEDVRAQVVLLRGADDLDDAFAAFRKEDVDALLSLEVPRTSTYGARIAQLALAERLPTMFGRDLAMYGPTLTFGTSLAAAARRMAGLVDQILKGALPGDLPVERVARRELIVNLRSARKIGVIIPPDVLARADHVIT
jgi:putative ABC transport system substrate-binding protein